MKRSIVTIAAAALVTLAGCSSNASGDKSDTAQSPSYASSPSTVAPATEEVAKTPETNERGNLPKAIGEQGSMFNTDSGADYFQFVVNSITPNFQCTAPYSQPSQNGQYLAINITVTGGPAIATVGGAVRVTPHDFQIVGLDGVAESGIQNGGTYGCVADTERFPMQGVGQGVTGTGTVVVDTKNASGYLVFRPAISGGSVGWEYKF